MLVPTGTYTQWWCCCRSDSDVLFLSAKFQQLLTTYGVQHQKALQLPNKASPSESNISIAKRMTREYKELHGIRHLITHGLGEIWHKLNARRGLKRLFNGKLSPIEVSAEHTLYNVPTCRFYL